MPGAGPSRSPHTSGLIDEGRLLGEVYNMVNVPTVVSIDEEDLTIRPNDVAFTAEKDGRYANLSTAAQMDLLRQWVRGDSEVSQEQFRLAGVLAPSGFMIRRGTIPLRGSDPFGEEFQEMVTELLQPETPTACGVAQ